MAENSCDRKLQAFCHKYFYKDFTCFLLDFDHRIPAYGTMGGRLKPVWGKKSVKKKGGGRNKTKG